MKILDYFMENPFWKSVYENAPSNECREYYRIMFEYFSFDTGEKNEEGINSADERLKELMLTREDAEYIMDHAGGSIARHQYGITIQWLFDDEKADTASASMFKGEIRNPDYTPAGMKIEEPRISSGSACFLIKDDSLKTWKGEFWDYLKNEGFRNWGVHGNWGCDWAYVNVNSKLYAPGMPGVGITQCVVSKDPKSALSIREFKEIWKILKRHEKEEKHLMLTAKEYRTWYDSFEEWEWETTSWRIYSDKSYRITLTFRPNLENREQRKKLRRKSGKLDDETFNELCRQLSVKNWGEPNRNDTVFDGSMWEIRQYSSDGKLIGSSGKVNFIDGRDRPLDKIVGCLPEI